MLEAFQPDFNEHGAVRDSDERRIAILGFSGIVASLCAAASALDYARKPAWRWIWGIVLGGMCAGVLFVVWIDIWEYPGGVG